MKKLRKTCLAMTTIGCCLLVMGLLAACSNKVDYYEKPTEENNNDVPTVDAITHAEKTLGVKIDKRQDWVLTVASSVTIIADAASLPNVAEVQVLSANPFAESAVLLGKAPVQQGGSATVSFRAPNYLTQLYAACVSKEGKCRAVPFQIGQQTVSFTNETQAASRASRSHRVQGTATEYGITAPQPTTNALNFGWTDTKQNIKNPPMTDYLSTWLPDLTQEAHRFLPRDKQNYDSLAAHPELQGQATIEVDDEGGEVLVTFIGGTSNARDRLGYCYYEGEGDMKTLRKFVITRHYDPYNYYDADYSTTPTTYKTRQMKLLYELPDGQYTTIFPANTKISWFIERDYYLDDDPPMFFGDGQLNKEVCQWLGNTLEDGHYDDSFAQYPDRQRIVVFSVNGHNLLSCEDWTDWEFNDKMFWVSGAVKQAPEPSPEPTIEPQVWTYAFEDTPLGDYDMNDVVFQARKHDGDTIKLDITLLAIGATYDIWVYFAANKTDVFGSEVHDLMKVARRQMVNTDGGITVDSVTVTVPRPANFDFQTNSFYIKVQTPEGVRYNVAVPTKGKEPHGVVIPAMWCWPKERVCIVKAYPKFAEWAKDIDNTKARDWYLTPDSSQIIIWK